MKTGDNKEFWQRMAKSYAPFMNVAGADRAVIGVSQPLGRN